MIINNLGERSHYFRFHIPALADHQRMHAYLHRLHACAHTTYLVLVAFHGPYHFAAMGMLILVIVGWLLREEVA